MPLELTFISSEGMTVILKSCHFYNIMAFITNVGEFQALLDGCSSTHDWELLLESILIPDEWIPMAYARLSELTAQEIPVSILFRL